LVPDGMVAVVGGLMMLFKLDQTQNNEKKKRQQNSEWIFTNCELTTCESHCSVQKSPLLSTDSSNKSRSGSNFFFPPWRERRLPSRHVNIAKRSRSSTDLLISDRDRFVDSVMCVT
jgi:hypothetical protein